MWGFTPVLRSLGQDMGLSAIVTTGCTVLFLLALALDPSGIDLTSFLGFLAPSIESSFVVGASGPVPVFQYGRWWTLLTASWLHGSLLHIVFNMMYIRQLAPAVAHLYGPGRATVIYLVAGVGGFVASTCSIFFPGFIVRIMGGGGGFTLGASAALFGLLGALVHYSRRTGSSAMGQQIWSWVIAFFIFGFVMKGVDNWAHLGGFLTGWALSAFFDPLRPERIDHLMAGLVGLLLTVLALGYSVWTGLPYLRLAN
jgi:rhomboid protease GluP